MASNEKRPPRRARRMALTGLLLAAIVIGWLLRDCGLGLGPGEGLGLLPGVGLGTDEATDTDRDTATDARAPVEPGIDARSGPCQLFLNSAGLTVDGRPATVEEAVRACRAAGKAHLDATGGALTGTYEELRRALEQAGVPVTGDD